MREQIVINAWELVTKFHSLKKVFFPTSFLGMLWLLMMLIYQVLFTAVYLFDKKDEALALLYEGIQKSYFWEVLLCICLVFIFYILLNPLSRGGVIRMIESYRKSDGKNPHRSWQGIFDGFSHFLPMFEIQNITAIFSPITIITTYIFCLRFFGTEFLVLISIIMGVYLLIAFLMNVCFSYASCFVILEGKKGTQALSASLEMAINNMNITARLYFTNLLLYIRTLFIGLLFLLVPLMISSTLTLFSGSIQIVLLIIFMIVFGGFFLFIVHLNSAIEVFVMSIWYEAYRACKEEGQPPVLHEGGM